jgi:hypothetical protein
MYCLVSILQRSGNQFFWFDPFWSAFCFGSASILYKSGFVSNCLKRKYKYLLSVQWMRIRVQIWRWMRIHADPDPNLKHCFCCFHYFSHYFIMKVDDEATWWSCLDLRTGSILLTFSYSLLSDTRMIFHRCSCTLLGQCMLRIRSVQIRTSFVKSGSRHLWQDPHPRLNNIYIFIAILC